ncbi:MAG: MBL fold metallo-hydrolase, partial [Candidatus Odinarchaeota archaeon]
MSEDIEIIFLGGAKQVGRSSFLVSSKKGCFLFDSGVNLSEGEEGKYPLESPDKPDYILLSHAHLDHSGYVPAMLGKYGCKLLTTPPTQDITEILSTDNLKIAKESGETVPYTMNDIMLIRKNSFDVNFRVKYKLKNDVTVTFYNAGHIIGSSMIKLTLGDKTIFYTGDISTRHTRTLDMADLKAEGGDIVIMESTYGGPEDKHPSTQKTERKFVSDINQTIKNGGKVLIPVFAVGRAQEVMITIDDYMRSGELAPAPVFIDGLIIRINELYKLFWEWLKPEIQKRIRYTRQSPLD